MNVEEEINNIQKKKIKEVVTEMITPIKMDFNVDLKAIKKSVDEIQKKQG